MNVNSFQDRELGIPYQVFDQVFKPSIDQVHIDQALDQVLTKHLLLAKYLTKHFSKHRPSIDQVLTSIRPSTSIEQAFTKHRPSI